TRDVLLPPWERFSMEIPFGERSVFRPRSWPPPPGRWPERLAPVFGASRRSQVSFSSERLSTFRLSVPQNLPPSKGPVHRLSRLRPACFASCANHREADNRGRSICPRRHALDLIVRPMDRLRPHTHPVLCPIQYPLRQSRCCLLQGFDPSQRTR